MRAGRADRKERIAALGQEHGLVPDMPTDHAPVGKLTERDALGKIGALRLGLLGRHCMLPWGAAL